MALQDVKYQAFIQKLVPNLAAEVFIGVRTPALRAFTKAFQNEGEEAVATFLANLPHTYYEENQMHGYILEGIKDFDTALKHLEAFLPFIDNWATCDQRAPKVFAKHTDVVFEKIKLWLTSEHPYTVRYAIGLLMNNYLGKAFSPEVLELVAAVESDEYYVKMMIAWFFCEALIKQYDSALPYLLEQSLEKWTHNKTIQKAVESRQFSDETKTYFRTLKI